MGKPEDLGGAGVRREPEVRVTHCIAFQKFRYRGENRPGRKQQDKDFLHLALYNMGGRVARVQIVCMDADRPDTVHPNGLVGRDCQHGVYTKSHPVSKPIQAVRIPYLRTERIKTRDTKRSREGGEEEGEGGDSASTIRAVLARRATLLPSPFRERCLEQRPGKPDTTRVRLGVIVTLEGTALHPLLTLTNVIQNASEKTRLKLLKLSTSAVSAMHGGKLDIFTSPDGPPITAGKCRVWVSVEGDHPWTSAECQPASDHILYSRVVTYSAPPYAPYPGTRERVEAILHVCCTQSDQSASCPFTYEPSGDSEGNDTRRQPGTAVTRKRPYDGGLEGILSRNVKLRNKENVGSGQLAGLTVVATPRGRDVTPVSFLQAREQSGPGVDRGQPGVILPEGLFFLSGQPHAVPVSPLPPPPLGVTPTPTTPTTTPFSSSSSSAAVTATAHPSFLNPAPHPPLPLAMTSSCGLERGDVFQGQESRSEGSGGQGSGGQESGDGLVSVTLPSGLSLGSLMAQALDSSGGLMGLLLPSPCMQE